MFSLFKRKNTEVEAVYEAIITDARQPKLYTEYNVPDTPIGRFEMVALHAMPYFVTYAKANEGGKTQALFDMIFADIEQSFREIGVGDLAVPKKMKRYMKDMNGMIQGHMAANADHVDIVRRNVFGDEGTMNTKFKAYIKGLFS